ncbi:MAG: porin family protein [Bacteroidetes bacterium]|nr:porin family protein [Bacteroidota bacterium]MDA0904037.1 porin family protein [Bacteroidota bacterium]MDA1242721.1 porin family protein [Bacteroidota bacterium]
MKRHVLVLGSLVATLAGHGQLLTPDVPWIFKGGYTLGVTAAQVRGDGIEGFNKLGFHGGVTLEIRQFQNVGFQLGLTYNQKGSRKVPNPKVDDYSNWGYKFTYVDIPITAVIDLKEGYTFGTGLQPGVLIGAWEDGLTSGVSDGVWEPTTLPIRPFELSWVVWVGMRAGETGEWFLRHTQSLPGIVPKPANPGPNARWDDRMQNLTMQLGYVKMFSP